MTPAASLAIVAASALLIASHRTAVGVIEAAPGDIGTFDLGAVADDAESLLYVFTETLQLQPAMTDTDTASQNIGAYLAVLRQAEGTASQADPYRVCYGYRHTIQDLRDHPAATGEWSGELLPDGMCRNAGLGPGCRSTAAGAYQMIGRTWSNLRNKLGLPDFGPASQDAAAVELIRQRGALEDVKAGRFDQAVYKCRAEWASLPGNYAKQGQRSMPELQAWYSQNGGTFA